MLCTLILKLTTMNDVESTLNISTLSFTIWILQRWSTWSNIVNKIRCKKLKNIHWVRRNKIFLTSNENHEYAKLRVSMTISKSFSFYSLCNMEKNVCNSAKILKTRKCCIAKTIFKLFHFLKYQLAFI